MHSKWKIWDFLKSGIHELKSYTGVLAIQCADPTSFSLIKQKIKLMGIPSGKINVELGKNISMGWFEEKFKTLSLFTEPETLLILSAENLPNDVTEELFKGENLILEERLVLLNYYKENSFLKKMKNSPESHVKVIQIEEPAFWEEDEVLTMLLELNQVYLGMGCRTFIKEHIPFDMSSYSQIISQIKINFSKTEELQPNDISELVESVKVDKFEYAELFGSKKLKLFYKKMIYLEQTGEDLIGVVSFIQSHMNKVYDCTYLNEKKRLTKYDRLIKSQSQIWDKSSCARSIYYLGNLMTDLKRKTPLTIEKLHLDYLKLSQS